MKYYITQIDSPIGMLTVRSDGYAVTGLWVENQKYFPDLSGDICKDNKLAVFADTKRWLDIYFSGQIPDFMPPMRACGTEFRQDVWRQLCSIPYGQTVTYGFIASRLEQSLGRKVCARAVGSACGHNPISILIPCHRVLGSGGALTGYASGTQKKLFLLSLEGAINPNGAKATREI